MCRCKLQNRRAEDHYSSLTRKFIYFSSILYNLSQSIPGPYQSGGIYHDRCCLRIKRCKVAYTVCMLLCFLIYIMHMSVPSSNVSNIRSFGHFLPPPPPPPERLPSLPPPDGLSLSSPPAPALHVLSSPSPVALLAPLAAAASALKAKSSLVVRHIV